METILATSCLWCWQHPVPRLCHDSGQL